MDAPPTDLEGPVTGEAQPRAPHGPPPPPRKNGFAFFAVLLGLYGVLGTAAQSASPVLGLVWSQAFALLLPALVAVSGSNLRATRALLLGRPSLAAAALAAAIGATAFVGAGSIMQLTSMLLPDRWLELFDVSKLFDRPPLERALLSVAAAVMAPFCEEVAFRGWLFTALRTRHSTGAAVVLSAVLFAVMHLDPVRFSALVALGALYAWLTWRSGSIWPAVLAHAANNGLGLSLASAGGTVTSLHELPRTREIVLGALVTLALAAIVLRVLALGYRRVTPAPPALGEALALRDPADPSTSFHLGRLPAGVLAAITAAGLSFAALAVLAVARHHS